MSTAAAQEMKALAWDKNKITASMMKPTNKQLAAVLRCKFKLHKEVKRTASKPVLLAKLALCAAKWRQKHQLPPVEDVGDDADDRSPDKRARRDGDADGGGDDDDDDDE